MTAKDVGEGLCAHRGRSSLHLTRTQARVCKHTYNNLACMAQDEERSVENLRPIRFHSHKQLRRNYPKIQAEPHLNRARALSASSAPSNTPYTPLERARLRSACKTSRESLMFVYISEL